MGTYQRGTVDTNNNSSSSTVRKTKVNVTTGSVILVPANPKRKGFYIYNNSANSVYLTFDSVSLSAEPTMILATFTQASMVAGLVYTGVISAIRNSGTGHCIVWELE